MRSVNYNRVVNMICDLNSSCAHTHMVGKSVLDLYVGRGCGWAVAAGCGSVAAVAAVSVAAEAQIPRFTLKMLNVSQKSIATSAGDFFHSASDLDLFECIARNINFWRMVSKTYGCIM